MMNTRNETRFDRHRRAGRLFAVLATVLALTCVFGGEREQAAGAQDATQHPVLLELFTSEGCSSCPPTDEWLQRVDASQPIPGVQVIVLSEHVDYWDHDGWKDPYSSELLTARQREYVDGLHLRDVYTPQLILDGSSELLLNDVQKTTKALEDAAATPGVSVRIDSVKVAAGNPHVLEGRIEVDPRSQGHGGDVYVATAIDHVTTKVLSGENGGHELTNVAVVEDLVKIGKLEKGKSFAQDFQVKLKPGSDPANLRVVAFVQEPHLGTVLGAAMEKNIR
ncbi:MAG: DUF1223 domain-containing protein [Silvibacterium sp.]